MNERILEGKVVYGKQLGRTIGFPTANIDVEDMEACPAGVYCGVSRVDETDYRVIINIGRHPTVPEGPPTVEAHLIGFEGNLYGRTLSVRLTGYLRGEKKFASLDELKAQLELDREAARRTPIGNE
ncbi:MAG: riboflavin kinase [Clostridia bacterium]|nr:riboflavin kinase [Clostridia bacterium]